MKYHLSCLRFYGFYVNDVPYPCQVDNFPEVYFFSGLILQAGFSNNSVHLAECLQTRFQAANLYTDVAMNNHQASEEYRPDGAYLDFDELR